MTEKKYTKKDYTSSQEVKWCPGCGDYAILSSVQMAMAQLQLPPENVCVVSGIGCSSRFPYYMNTYGMHSIHGRAPAFATGIKLQNPELSVWLITGDGDGLSIGGNHFAHLLRRNVDLNLILFNNEIYGLTKGQYSPTSSQGTKTKSTPFGSVDRSFTPSRFALGAGCTFFARTIDTDPKHMIETFKQADAHRGTSVVEVLQNCVIFNDKVHDRFTNREMRDDHTVRLEDGQPMIFGKDKDKCIVLDGLDFLVKNVADTDEKDILIHNSHNERLSQFLCHIGVDDSTLPLPLGVLRSIEAQGYIEEVIAQEKRVYDTYGQGDIKKLLYSGDTWEVGQRQ